MKIRLIILIVGFLMIVSSTALGQYIELDEAIQKGKTVSFVKKISNGKYCIVINYGFMNEEKFCFNKESKANDFYMQILEHIEEKI